MLLITIIMLQKPKHQTVLLKTAQNIYISTVLAISQLFDVKTIICALYIPKTYRPKSISLRFGIGSILNIQNFQLHTETQKGLAEEIRTVIHCYCIVIFLLLMLNFIQNAKHLKYYIYVILPAIVINRNFLYMQYLG